MPMTKDEADRLEAAMDAYDAQHPRPRQPDIPAEMWGVWWRRGGKDRLGDWMRQNGRVAVFMSEEEAQATVNDEINCRYLDYEPLSEGNIFAVKMGIAPPKEG